MRDRPRTAFRVVSGRLARDVGRWGLGLAFFGARSQRAVVSSSGSSSQCAGLSASECTTRRVRGVPEDGEPDGSVPDRRYPARWLVHRRRLNGFSSGPRRRIELQLDRRAGRSLRCVLAFRGAISITYRRDVAGTIDGVGRSVAQAARWKQQPASCGTLAGLLNEVVGGRVWPIRPEYNPARIVWALELLRSRATFATSTVVSARGLPRKASSVDRSAAGRSSASGYTIVENVAESLRVDGRLGARSSSAMSPTTCLRYSSSTLDPRAEFDGNGRISRPPVSVNWTTQSRRRLLCCETERRSRHPL